MKRRVYWISAVLAAALVIHLVTVFALPYAILAYAGARFLSSSDGKANTIFHLEPVTAETRDVVMLSPDLLYSVCAYDVSKRPVRIVATVPDTYWSVSFYASNTDNFFVANDRQANAAPAEWILTSKHAQFPGWQSAVVIIAPSPKGVILFRTLVTDESRLDELIGIQKQASCEPVF